MIFTGLPAGAQSASDIERIVKSSKHVDNTRPIRAVIGSKSDRSGKEISISTYSHPKASDKDCKINSLFIMKDVLQHYKTVHRINISYYDPRNPSSYRTVQVTEGDVALVDHGKPVEDVLSDLPLTSGAVAPPTPGRSQTSFSGTTFSGIPSLRTASETTKLTTFTSSDGSISIALPQGALTMRNPEPGTLVRCINLIVGIDVWCSDNDGTTFEKIVEMMENRCSLAYPQWEKTKEQPYPLKGYRGIYMEGNVSATKKLRGLFVQGRNHVYTIAVTGLLKNDAQVESLFRQMIASLTIRD